MSLDPNWTNAVRDFLDKARWRIEEGLRAVLDRAENLTDYDDPRSESWFFEYDMPTAITSRVVTPGDFNQNSYNVIFESEPPVMWHERIVPWEYDL